MPRRFNFTGRTKSIRGCHGPVYRKESRLTSTPSCVWSAISCQRPRVLSGLSGGINPVKRFDFGRVGLWQPERTGG